MQRVKIQGQVLNSRQAKWVQIASIFLEKERWTVDDFAKILGFRDYGLLWALTMMLLMHSLALKAIKDGSWNERGRYQRKTLMIATGNTSLSIATVLPMDTSS